MAPTTRRGASPPPRRELASLHQDKHPLIRLQADGRWPHLVLRSHHTVDRSGRGQHDLDALGVEGSRPVTRMWLSMRFDLLSGRGHGYVPDLDVSRRSPRFHAFRGSWFSW